MAQIKFGTDGWRAVIAEDYTFDNVRKVAQATCEYFKKEGYAKDGLVIGYDTRFDSEHFAAATAEVFAANGVKVYLSNNFAPTPVFSYSIIEKKAGGGVVITASHNPATDNGFKVKPHYGGSASPEIVTAIEGLLDTPIQRMKFQDAVKAGLVEYFDATEGYIEQLGRMVDIDGIRKSNLKILVDSMYGAGQGYFPRILSGGTATVTNMHNERNPIFPGMHNPEPIARNLTEHIELMKTGKYDIGISNDGDADRVGLVDEKGEFVDQLRVYALLALYMLEVRGERGMIVRSLSTTSMLDQLGKLYNVPVFETPVGFKHIGPKMMAENALMGGEESGGFGFRGHIPERDGIICGLFLADMLVKTGKTVSGLIDWLFEKVGPHYYNRIDFTFEQEKRGEIMQRIRDNTPKDLAGSKLVNTRFDDGFKYYSEDGSWLLIRFSGTEPIMRAYTETTSPEKVEAILAQGRAITGV
ncbi:phosphoglucomutase/phosphomannomutase family protein [Candidatus Chlorohelix sp.]|uniref:phosphoglucomutase/phosphomannomutase family protein n=1 Tax=Candidatus Chlorohelix sp. TaxID=3139201 RepID=UPI00302C783A